MTSDDVAVDPDIHAVFAEVRASIRRDITWQTRFLCAYMTALGAVSLAIARLIY